MAIVIAFATDMTMAFGISLDTANQGTTVIGIALATASFKDMATMATRTVSKFFFKCSYCGNGIIVKDKDKKQYMIAIINFCILL